METLSRSRRWSGPTLDRIVAVTARPAYRVWIRFEDGLEGEVSLAPLVGREVFASWEDEAEFQKVLVDQ